MNPQYLTIASLIVLLFSISVLIAVIRETRKPPAAAPAIDTLVMTPSMPVVADFRDGLAAELVAAFREGLKPIPQIKDCAKCKGSGKIHFTTPSDLTSALRASLLEEIKASRKSRRS